MKALNAHVSWRSPVLIALGSNMPGPTGSSRETVAAAVRALRGAGIEIYRVSPSFRSAPVPPSPQAFFVNAAVCARTALGPERLLAQLHAVERLFGRVRRRPNAPRTLDLDLLVYGNEVSGAADHDTVILPHPRAHLRAFVLQPLRLIAPAWRHPVLGSTPDQLLRRLPPRAVRRPALLIDRPLRAPVRRLKKNVRPKKP